MAMSTSHPSAGSTPDTLSQPNGIGSHLAQVAALPVRRAGDGLEVLLVTSRETHRWIVPKGWPMKGRKDHDAAAREALEEAGVRGKIHKRPLGSYVYGKRLAEGVEMCRVMVYRLDVEEECASWPEGDERDRQWLGVREAASRVEEPGLATIIRSLDRAAGRSRQGSCAA